MVELASYDFMRSLLRLRIRGRLNRSISVTVFEMKAARLRGDPFDALGASNRRAIVELLGSGGRTVGELADSLPIRRPAVPRHLRLLKDAGLVIDELLGAPRIYKLQDRCVEPVHGCLIQLSAD